jgi:hypothetical protein
LNKPGGEDAVRAAAGQNFFYNWALGPIYRLLAPRPHRRGAGAYWGRAVSHCATDFRIFVKGPTVAAILLKGGITKITGGAHPLLHKYQT